MIFNKGNICIFQSHETRHLSLALDNGVATGMVSGSYCLRYRAHLGNPEPCPALLNVGFTGVLQHGSRQYIFSLLCIVRDLSYVG